MSSLMRSAQRDDLSSPAKKVSHGFPGEKGTHLYPPLVHEPDLFDYGPEGRGEGNALCIRDHHEPLSFGRAGD
jgi:hypothetical protein